MIERISDHGYKLSSESMNSDFGKIMLEHKPVKCVICNFKTSRVLRPHYLGRNIVTVNKSVPDDVFYVNRIDRKEGEKS